MKIGMLTIGQSPRGDIIPTMTEVLGKECEIVERGALDDLTIKDIKRIEFRADDYILVSKMRDGTEIRITKRFVIPLLQERIHELEKLRVKLIVIMCTGKFPPFDSKGLVVTPQEILKGVIEGSLKKGKLGVIYPAKEQMMGARSEFGREGVEVYADFLSPYEGKSGLDDLADRLANQSLDLIFLNCFGFDSKVKKAIAKKTGKPVIQSNAVIARVLRELTA